MYTIGTSRSRDHFHERLDRHCHRMLSDEALDGVICVWETLALDELGRVWEAVRM